ncbi:hypothetical protein [Nocardia sp. NPDC004604]|uniref:hypothetical protein n=1 Tax=Nocardia sp. NPDC004604 TaxID=3157013 RepID=UPI0033A55CC0
MPAKMLARSGLITVDPSSFNRVASTPISNNSGAIYRLEYSSNHASTNGSLLVAKLTTPSSIAFRVTSMCTAIVLPSPPGMFTSANFNTPKAFSWLRRGVRGSLGLVTFSL